MAPVEPVVEPDVVLPDDVEPDPELEVLELLPALVPPPLADPAVQAGTAGALQPAGVIHPCDWTEGQLGLET